MKKLSSLQSELDGLRNLVQRINDSLELARIEDESLRAELEHETTIIEKEISQLEFTAMLSGKHDKGDALLAIHAGAGGTDSQDWAEMLQRMYLRWCELRGFETEILDTTLGEEAGVKSVTIAVNGALCLWLSALRKGRAPAGPAFTL